MGEEDSSLCELCEKDGVRDNLKFCSAYKGSDS